MFRAATQEATTIVLTERLWSAAGRSGRVAEDRPGVGREPGGPGGPVASGLAGDAGRRPAADGGRPRRSIAADGVVMEDPGRGGGLLPLGAPLILDGNDDQPGAGGRATGVGRGRGDSPATGRASGTRGRRAKTGRSRSAVAVRCRVGRAGPGLNGRPGRRATRHAVARAHGGRFRWRRAGSGPRRDPRRVPRRTLPHSMCSPQSKPPRRPATRAEQELLAGWSSWGALPKVFDDSDDEWAAMRARAA